MALPLNLWTSNFPPVLNRMKEIKCNQVMNDISRGLNSSLKVYNYNQTLLRDTLPLIDIILKPSLRPVNPTLFNEVEKKDFRNLINIMVDFNFNYIQQREVDGTYSYQLDPNIDELIKFNDVSSNNDRAYSYFMKQIISHELELERLRRSDASQGIQKTTKSEDERVDISLETRRSSMLQPKQITEKDKYTQCKDFFGRVVNVNASTVEVSGGDKQSFTGSPVWFSFKEGYNNAVKRDIVLANIL